MDGLKVSTETKVRTLALVIVLVYQILAALGFKLPYLDESIALDWAANIISFAVVIWAWWKNNSFTQAALIGDELKDEIKAMGRGDDSDEVCTDEEDDSE